MNKVYEHMLSPLTIRGKTLKNRLAASKFGPLYSTWEYDTEFYCKVARNGAAIVTVPPGAFPSRALEYLPDGKRISFGAFVNPMICWGGLLSLLVLIYTAAVRRDRTAAFLLIAYLSGLVPWMFITRLTFAYHYFASALFLVPSLCYVFSMMERAPRLCRRYPVWFTAVSVLLFAWFFPVLNGITVENALATKLLGWLPSWPF